MGKVVLIQPKVGEWDEIRSAPQIPLALLFASSLVEKDYEVKIIDQRLDKNWENSLRKELNSSPLCVGTTAMTGKQIKFALDALKIVKIESKIPTVLGGVHASLLPEQTLANPNIDIVVQGEGEITFYELVKFLDKEKPLKQVKGIWYKNKECIKNSGMREFSDLNKLPDLPYHLIEVKDYLPKFKGKKSINMYLSRGCVFKCAFCYNAVYNRSKWRCVNDKISLERIKRVIDDFGVEKIDFLDDEFFIDWHRAKNIIEGIVREKFDIICEFFGIRVDQISRMDQEYLKTLEKAGCRKLHLGVESGSERIINMVKKNITPRQVISLNRKLKNYNFIPQYNFMAGFPTETIKEIKMTIDLILRLLKENPKAIISPICTYTPYPGTELFDFAVKDGFKIPEKLEGWADFDYGSIPWINEKRRRFLESLYIASLFLSGDRYMINSLPVKLFAKLYKPFAEYRVRNMNFGLMIEKTFKKIFEDIY
jgi:radical SAM superfamily enzyme YgiQ (UPF0313 family)